MKHLESHHRRYKNVSFFTEKLMSLLKKYKLYIDVISNYIEDHYYGLKGFKPFIINYDPKKNKKTFIISNHYICLKIEDKAVLEKLLRKGGDYLQFQFRICDGDVGAISEEEAKLFEMKEEISETLFKDPRTIIVIKDKFDCLGFHIVYRDDIEKKYEDILKNIGETE